MYVFTILNINQSDEKYHCSFDTLSHLNPPDIPEPELALELGNTQIPNTKHQVMPTLSMPGFHHQTHP